MFKDNWSESFARMDAWWEGEVLDRCVVAVTAPRKKPLIASEIAAPDDLRERWLNPEYRLAKAETGFAKTFFGGEALPAFTTNVGPGSVASYLGPEPVFARDTVWFDRYPVVIDWDNPPHLEFDEDNYYWKRTKELTRRSAGRSAGKYLTGIADLGGSLDIIASLRGTEKLLVDLYDYGDQVKALTAKVDEIWFRYFNELDSIVTQKMEGCVSWMEIWCRKKWYPLQCDFSAMISPDMFEEFVLPSLQQACRNLDYSIYHWDGPGQIPHLDQLLSIPELTGIQWTPGDGQEPKESEKWLPLYKRIQEAGKNLILFNVSPKGVKWCMSNLSPKGLYISTRCNSEEEAENLLKDVSSWTTER